MRISYLLLTFILFANNLHAEESIVENSPVLKLGIFAAACDAAQIRELFARNPDMDINGYQPTLTPVQLAQERLGKAITDKNLTYQEACLKTVLSISSHPKYKWKEIGSRQTTDLMHLVRTLKDANRDVLNTTLRPVLAQYKKIKDFDINYRLGSAHGKNRAGTVAGSLAVAGNPETWCVVKSEFTIDFERRPSLSHYTPLLLAVNSNQLEMVKLLVGEGTDWYVGIDTLSVPWAAFEIAKTQNFMDIRDWLMKHKSAAERGVDCEAI